MEPDRLYKDGDCFSSQFIIHVIAKHGHDMPEKNSRKMEKFGSELLFVEFSL